ncbi:glycosyltransferase family 2 protein [Anaerolineales bacterium HSG6]|nr:glycosyltransferase family 2 protein [Anaerolineales bacterium HSG6]
MSTTLSIVTPSYNQADFLPTTIASVLEQSYPALEYFIVDGASTDGTVDILRQHGLSGWAEGQNDSRNICWISEPDHGQAEAINKGFRRTTGEIVGWLNSDDIYLPEAFERVATFFQNYPHVDVIYGDYHLIDEHDQIILRKKEIPFDYNILLYGLDYISQPTVFFRRAMLEQVGYLDEQLNYGLDWDYWLRLAQHGGTFQHVPHYLAATRLHGTAKTVVAPPAMYAEHEKIRNRYWNKHRFQSSTWQRIYASILNKQYRFKRQLLKIGLRRTIDFPPSHWVMARQ